MCDGGNVEVLRQVVQLIFYTPFGDRHCPNYHMGRFEPDFGILLDSSTILCALVGPLSFSENPIGK